MTMSMTGEASTSGGRESQIPATARDSDLVDHDEAAEITEDHSNDQSTGKTPVDDIKLDEILKAFQSQLDFQQGELNLLRGLTKPKKSQASKPNPTFEDYERAIEWLDYKSPNGVHWKKLSEDFIRSCRSQDILWFSAAGSLLGDNKNFLSTYRVGENPQGRYVLEPRPDSFSETTPQMQRLLDCWPESLAVEREKKVGWTGGFGEREEEFRWTEKFGICDWYFFNGGGKQSLAQSWSGFSGGSGWTTLRSKMPPQSEILLGSRPGHNKQDKIPFGQVIRIVFRASDRISLSTMAFVALQLSTQSKESSSRPAELLLCSFVSNWAEKPEMLTHVSQGHITKIHAIRYFSVARVEGEPLSFGDIPIIRESGQFYRSNGRVSDGLRESRISLALVADYSNSFPCFTVVLLMDGWEGKFPSTPDIMKPDHPLSSLFMIDKVIDDAVQYICRCWEDVLRALDLELSVKVPDLFDDTVSERLMFDNKPFTRSKTYFRMQQLCRIFGNTIEETIRDLKETQSQILTEIRMRQPNFSNTIKETIEQQIRDIRQNPDMMVGGEIHVQIDPKYFDNTKRIESELENLSTEWEKHTANQSAKLNVLLDRVRKKGEEVASLRDGLFNASSVREASKSTEIASISILQNRYIFVFTVTTVIYLPLGFVTSVFGMHLFDTTDPEVVASRRKFCITIIMLSVATYAAAFVAYLHVRSGRADPTAEGVQDEESPKEESQSEKASVGGGNYTASGISRWRKGAGLGLFRRWKGGDGKVKASNNSAA